MDRRHLYFLLFLLCTIQAAIGQQRSFSIKGVVKDASSGQPIPFANVVVWNTTQGGGHRFHRIIRDIRHITRKLSSPILLSGI